MAMIVRYVKKKVSAQLLVKMKGCLPVQLANVQPQQMIVIHVKAQMKQLRVQTIQMDMINIILLV